MSDRSLPANRTHSPAMVKTEPGSPDAGQQQGGGADEGNGPTRVRTTPPVQNGFHGSGSDSDSGVDAPLDFSMKSRNRLSDGGSDADSKDGLGPLKPEPMDCSNQCTSPSSEGKPTEEGSSNGDGEVAERNGINKMIGEPPTALPGVLPGAAGAAMPGMLPNAGLFANLPMYMDPRRMQQIQSQQPQSGNKSTARPFKAYPKDPLSLPLGFYGIPGMLPFPSIDTVTAQAMNMSSEEVFNQYRNYVMRLQQDQAKNTKGGKSLQAQEQQKQIDQLKQQIELHQKQQLHSHLQQQQQEQIREHLREHQQQQQQQQQQQHHHQSVPSQPSPSGKSSISETSTTARSNSSSPNTTCTTPIPTSPNGAQTAAGPTTGSGDGEATTSNTSPGSGTGEGPGTPGRKRGRTLPDEQKDQAYWERRRKNNEAAKRSRDSRRAKEDEIAIRAAFLEQENLKLRVEVAALKNETAKLRCMLYNS